jgi:hypothetical protein
LEHQNCPSECEENVAINANTLVVRGQYAPPIIMSALAVAVGAGLISGVIGYELKDDGRRPANSFDKLPDDGGGASSQ